MSAFDVFDESPTACKEWEDFLHKSSGKDLDLTPDEPKDFVKWAYERKDELIAGLGVGYHYGEWWGQGIQRTYGLDHKRFPLFDTRRWNEHHEPPEGVYVVPILPVTTVEEARYFLREQGSLAAKGYDRPEGAVMYDPDTRTRFKIIIDK